MRVAASSPAWLTRSAEERKSRCAWVKGLRLPLCILDGEPCWRPCWEPCWEPCWDLEEGADGAVVGVGGLLLSATSAGRAGVVESSRLELEVNSAGARKS